MAEPAAFVTGGGSGIGRASAQALARAGMNVVVADINEAAAQTVAAEVAELGAEGLALRCDVTSEDSVRSAIEQTESRFGRLDVLVNSAGVDLHKELGDIELEDWQRVMDINVTGSFLCMKHARQADAAQQLRAYDLPWIIVGDLRHGLARLLGGEGGACRPGAVGGTRARASRDHGQRRRSRPDRDAAVARPMGQQSRPARTAGIDRASGRVAKPEEIAAAIAYLASEDAGFVTGSTLVIDGGLTSLMRRPSPQPSA